MAYNGFGVFNRLYSWTQDASNGINIRADRMDAEMTGFATGLSLCMTRDSQAAMTQDLKMGNKKIINLANPVADQDAATKKWTTDNFLAVSSGGLFQWGSALTQVVDFKVGVQTGWYGWTGSSLNGPPSGAGGAMNFPRTGTNSGNSLYGWLAFNSSGGTGTNIPHVYVAATSGTANDLGSWYELMHAGNFDTLMPATMSTAHSWTINQTFNGGITQPQSTAGLVQFGATAVDANNQLHIRFGGTSPGNAGRLYISSVGTNWLSFQPLTRTFDANGTVSWTAAVDFSGGGTVGSYTHSGNLTATGNISAAGSVTAAGNLQSLSASGNKGVFLGSPTLTGFNGKLRYVGSDDSVQVGSFNDGAGLAGWRFFTGGEIRQEAGFLSGINFGSATGSSGTDVSRHIDLYGGVYGFGVTASALNINMSGSALAYFRQGGTIVARIDDAGTALSASYSVVTREKGDNRYLDADNMNTGTTPIGRYGTSSSFRDWVGGRVSEIAWNGIGSTVMAYLTTELTTGPGTIRSGSDLAPCPVGDLGSGTLGAGTTWMCCGRVVGGGNDAITLWRRVT